MESVRLFFQTHERTAAQLRGIAVAAVVAPEGLAIQQAVQVHVPAGKLPGVREVQDLDRRWF